MAIIACYANATRADTSTHDGRWWIRLSALEKAIYTTGILDGVDVGEGISVRRGLDATDDYVKEVHHLFGKVNTKQMVDGIDVFYRDFRNRSIPTYAAAWFVAMQISGADEARLQEFLVQMRRGA